MVLGIIASKSSMMCVCPILDYATCFWGFKDIGKIDTVQNRAMKSFLGVHKYTPTNAIYGEFGWQTSRDRRKLNILRFWNKLCRLDDDRILKQVFLWDYNLNISFCSASTKHHQN